MERYLPTPGLRPTRSPTASSRSVGTGEQPPRAPGERDPDRDPVDLRQPLSGSSGGGGEPSGNWCSHVSLDSPYLWVSRAEAEDEDTRCARWRSPRSGWWRWWCAATLAPCGAVALARRCHEEVEEEHGNHHQQAAAGDEE